MLFIFLCICCCCLLSFTGDLLRSLTMDRLKHDRKPKHWTQGAPLKNVARVPQGVWTHPCSFVAPLLLSVTTIPRRSVSNVRDTNCWVKKTQTQVYTLKHTHSSAFATHSHTFHSRPCHYVDHFLLECYHLPSHKATHHVDQCAKPCLAPSFCTSPS